MTGGRRVLINVWQCYACLIRSAFPSNLPKLPSPPIIWTSRDVSVALASISCRYSACTNRNSPQKVGNKPLNRRGPHDNLIRATTPTPLCRLILLSLTSHPHRSSPKREDISFLRKSQRKSFPRLHSNISLSHHDRVIAFATLVFMHHGKTSAHARRAD